MNPLFEATGLENLSPLLQYQGRVARV